MLNRTGVSGTPDTVKQHANNPFPNWSKQVTNFPPSLELPFDYRRSTLNSFSVQKFSSAIPRFLYTELSKFCFSERDKLSTVLVTAFSVLLYRYSNQPQVLVSVIYSKPVKNVDYPESLMHPEFTGMFLQPDLSDDPGFMDLLDRFHEIVSVNEANKHMTFKSWIEAMNSGGIQVDSLFQIVFGFQGLGDYGHRTPCTIPDSAKPDLWLSIEESLDGLTAHWQYNTGLFKEGTIKRLAGHFQNLLFAIAENPKQSIRKYPLLSSHERLQILFEWNDTTAEFPRDRCIHELFEQQASLTPDAIAVECVGMNDRHPTASQHFTYHELNSKANQLAHYLCDLGVRPGVLVGVCAGRSLDMIVGLLGVLKAGGAYLPLDTAYPRERLQFMLRDSGVRILLTQRNVLKDIPLECDQLVCLENVQEIERYPTINLVVNIQPQDLAYVIYTSGSTGTPKGTMIVHRGVVNYLSWCIREYAVEGGSGAPVNSSIAFDATVTSVFAPLLSGKRILLLPEKDEIEALSTALLSERDFSLVKITPAHLEILQHLIKPERLKNQVRVIVIGGESLSYENIAPWRHYAKGTRLINEYGPTETVVGCCVYEVRDESAMTGDVPIGRPIANTQIYILDGEMQPVPIGVPGEIFIGGAGVARGYLNRPDLTNERFVSNPFIDDTHQRLYKTGDLGRYLHDGNIVFLGRIDHQVKIRGYRIELAEIETALLKLPGVTQAVVIARNDYPEKRLVAYIVARNQVLSTNALRSFLGNTLPGYMIPSAFVFMNNLPLTPNGKVDRNALPIPDHENTGSANMYVAPRTKLETQLTAIFQKALNIPKIGVTEDFFELGGSSIRAAEIFSEIGNATGKHLPLSTLIGNPTIEKLALFIEGEQISRSCLVPIQTRGSKTPLFCVHGGWGHVLFYRHLAKHLGTDQPLYALEAKGLTGNEEPNDDLVKMAAHYIREIRSVQPTGPYYLAGYCFGAIVAFEMARQLLAEGDTMAFVGSFNGIAPKVAQISKPGSVKKAKPLTANGKHYSLRRLRKAVKIYLMVRWYRLLVKMRSLTYKYLSLFGFSLPQALRRWHIFDAISRALKTYNPEPYTGELTIFRSPGIFKSPELGWSPLITGGIKTYDIPGDHKDRTRIMYEPFVSMLAEAVKKRLAECVINAGTDLSIPQEMRMKAITFADEIKQTL